MVLVMHSQWRFLIIISTCFVALCSSASLPVKAVNLGGWLVTEGWMTPRLFDNIPNREMLDGTRMQLKSLKLNTYISAESGGNNVIVAKYTSARDWETFKLWRVNETTFNLRVFRGQFVRISQRSSKLVALATNPTATEEFMIIRNPNNFSRVRIRAPNGLFVQAQTTDAVTADYSQEGTNWGNNDLSVFEMTLLNGQLTDEFQLTNGYGSGAASVLMKHWSTYITEDDFRSMANDKLTAVRIPVGWWIASGQNPPKPFVGGSLQFLDKAFDWAERYSLGVIVDLHAPPGGSQNGNDHSGTRDGTKDWGTDESINQTVEVIDFLASRAETLNIIVAAAMVDPNNETKVVVATSIDHNSPCVKCRAQANTVQGGNNIAHAKPSSQTQIPGLSEAQVQQIKAILNNTAEPMQNYQDCNSRMLIGVGEHKNGVYYYHSRASGRVCHTNRNEDHELWHQRMGHPSYQLTSLISGVKNDSSSSKVICEICLKAKQIRDVFPISLNKANEPFELIHCDI